MSLSNEDITARNFKKFYEAIYPYLNGSAHAGFTPVGTVISVMGNSAPKNYLICDGTSYNISAYPELAEYFDHQFGSVNYFGGDGVTTFAVPDLRGEFLRGTGTNSHENQGSGDSVGAHQDGTRHVAISATLEAGNTFITTANTGTRDQDVKDPFTNTNYFSSSAYADSSSGLKSAHAWAAVGGKNTSQDVEWYTSRPTNTSVLYCIAYKNIYIDAVLTYSTEEQVIGTWIDGKPLFQRTLTGTTISGTSGVIVTGLTEIDYIELVHFQCSMGTYRKNLLDSVSIKEDGSEIFMIADSDSLFRNQPFYATVRYTKSTV